MQQLQRTDRSRRSVLRAARLADLVATYETAISELLDWNDPALAHLLTSLEALHAEAIASGERGSWPA